MYGLPSSFSYVLGMIVAALLATGTLDSVLAPVFRPKVIVESALSQSGAKTTFDHSRKSDRLPVVGANPVTPTTIIRKNVDPKPTPAPLLDCEELASPASDPILSRLIGRCFV